MIRVIKFTLMEITVSIPDSLVPAGETKDILARKVLEAYAIQNYRQEMISLGRLAEILDMSIDEANGFLKEHNVPSNYNLDDLVRDRRTLEMFLENTAAHSNDI